MEILARLTLFTGIIYLFFLWLLFAVTHSWLASEWLKAFLAKKISMLKYAYRLFYNVISLIIIAAIVYIHFLIDVVFIIEPGLVMKLLAILLASLGAVIAVVGFRSYDLWEFLGLIPEGDTSVGLVTSGLNAYVRHPLYLGAIMILIALCIYQPTWDILFSVVMAIVYFVVGIKFEEAKLKRTFASYYIRYAESTPCLIPNKPLQFLKRLFQ